MSKTSTLTTILTLTLSSVCLQTNFALARGSHFLLTTSKMAGAANGPAETITQTSSPTITDTSTRIKPMMESFANAQGDARGKPNYFIGINVKHTAPISSIGPRVNINVAKFGALRNPAATGGAAPKGPTGTIYGNDNSKSGTVPGFGYGKSGFGKGVNLPGGNNSNGIKSVPGFDNIGNGPGVNLPGGKKKGSAADAANFMAAQENADVAALLNAASQGPDVNVPSQSTAAQQQADGLLDTVINYLTGDAKDGEKSAGSNGEKQDGASRGTKLPERAPTSRVISATLGKDGRIITLSDNEYDIGGQLISGMTIGPQTTISPRGGSKKTPNDADTSTPVNSSSSLALNNPFTARNQGGGTDNNVDQAGVGTSDIAPNSSYAQKENGGGGNDAGENQTTSSGALASNSSLAKKDQGDGGGNDDRGGGNAGTLGKIKVNGSPTNGQLAAQSARGR